MKQNFIPFVISMLTALLISVCLVLLFSLVVLMFNLSDGWVTAINYVIKLCSIIVGTIGFAKGKRGAFKGLIFGFVYFLLAQLVFSIIANNFSVSLATLYDLIYCLIVGVLSGVLSVNVKKA
ncbi:MAG: TIGR04086 family membrane protein [Clostridia bacterium]|nr:TIGR04086 family membrane protein [Clostridia bacterium]